jgi:hypothetical protein
MARIKIPACSNATRELGCSVVVCPADLRGRKGAFAFYPKEEKLTLAGVINCPGCPTLKGPYTWTSCWKGTAADKAKGPTFESVQVIPLRA